MPRERRAGSLHLGWAGGGQEFELGTLRLWTERGAKSLQASEESKDNLS